MTDHTAHQDLGFDVGFGVEIHSMTEDDEGSHSTQPGESVHEYSVIAKEYHSDGCITVHYDEDFETYELAASMAEPWAKKWDVEIEDVGP